MSYSSTSSAHKLNHGDIDNDTQSGVTTEIVANAFAMVKSRIEAVGLTPPATSSILTAAENFYIKAESVWKGRMMGHLPTGQGGIVSQDNVNKSYELFMRLGDEKVDQYIASVSTDVQPNDTDGQPRDDGIADSLNLHEGAMPTFTES